MKFGGSVRNEHGREVEVPTEQGHALSGAFLKSLAARAGIGQASLDEHGRELLEDCYAMSWAGKFGSEWRTDVEGSRVKALLNDSVSGGAEAVPIHFDADIVSYPLLHSEVAPFVDLRQVPRVSNVEAEAVGNPEMNWTIESGTTIPLFDTTGLVTSLDTTIHTLTCAVEVSRDFMADSPADVWRVLTENVGMRLSAELDRVIASGNGSTEPEGVFVASGTTSANSDNGSSGPPTLSDYEQLLFSVAKQYRSASMRCRFVSNDTSYQRRSGLKVDPASTSTDERRLLGMAHNDYSTLGWPHSIQNDVANTKIGFVAMGKYRRYRRLGATIEWVTSGASSSRRNMALLIVRARFERSTRRPERRGDHRRHAAVTDQTTTSIGLESCDSKSKSTARATSACRSAPCNVASGGASTTPAARTRWRWPRFESGPVRSPASGSASTPRAARRGCTTRSTTTNTRPSATASNRVGCRFPPTKRSRVSTFRRGSSGFAAPANRALRGSLRARFPRPSTARFNGPS